MRIIGELADGSGGKPELSATFDEEPQDEDNPSLFNVLEGAHLTIENVRFRNVQLDDDYNCPAIYVRYRGTLTVQNCGTCLSFTHVTRPSTSLFFN